jgi:sulfite reductase alpha subunit-like flavoprotein
MRPSAPHSNVPDSSRLRALVETVGAFALRDRTLRAAQAAMERALATGEPDPAEAQRYLAGVRRYFTRFSAEADGHLKAVDRELEALYARQYNLTAERGVAAKRIEVTQGVLSALAEIGRA